jgi:site-specific DNA recombinase
LKRQKEDFNSIVAEFEDYVKYCTELVESFDKLYLQGDIHTKQQILGSIFSEKLVFENNQYRTIQLHLVVSIICGGSAGIKQKDETKTSEKDVLSRQVGSGFLMSVLFLADLDRFEGL